MAEGRGAVGVTRSVEDGEGEVSWVYSCSTSYDHVERRPEGENGKGAEGGGEQ